MGAGYVGLSVALLLARHHTVHVVDINPMRVAAINARTPYFSDAEMRDCLVHCDELGLSIQATQDPVVAYLHARYVIVAVPTNFDPDRNNFDTGALESAVGAIRAVNNEAWIVIRSTVPIGYTEALAKRRSDERILVSPEFLREGHALLDNLHPSRVIVGTATDNGKARAIAHSFAQILAAEATADEKLPTEHPMLMVCTAREAESIKLFSNTYLALRVAFFNELDTFCEANGLDTGTVIRGTVADTRIGNYYDNPSFGYGGYCLPKDTKQLLSRYRAIPQDLIGAVVASNHTRKRFIVDEVFARVQALRGRDEAQPIVGVYRLTMKQGSDNFRESSIIDVISGLRERGVTIRIYEPLIGSDHFMDCPVEQDLPTFKRRCTIILANRWTDELSSCRDKVYTRDLFHRD